MKLEGRSILITGGGQRHRAGAGRGAAPARQPGDRRRTPPGAARRGGGDEPGHGRRGPRRGRSGERHRHRGRGAGRPPRPRRGRELRRHHVRRRRGPAPRRRAAHRHRGDQPARAPAPQLGAHGPPADPAGGDHRQRVIDAGLRPAGVLGALLRHQGGAALLHAVAALPPAVQLGGGPGDRSPVRADRADAHQRHRSPAPCRWTSSSPRPWPGWRPTTSRCWSSGPGSAATPSGPTRVGATHAFNDLMGGL